jgi:hypothetical protein
MSVVSVERVVSIDGSVEFFVEGEDEPMAPSEDADAELALYDVTKVWGDA